MQLDFLAANGDGDGVAELVLSPTFVLFMQAVNPEFPLTALHFSSPPFAPVENKIQCLL